MLSITNGVITLVVTINKEDQILFIPANKGGKAYLATSLPSTIISNPATTMKNLKIEPTLDLVWSDSENNGKGGIAFIPSNGSLTPSTVKLLHQARKITAQFTRINDLFTYLSDDQLNLVARDHLVNLFNYSSDQAANATEEYLIWLANKGSEQLKLDLLRDTLLPHEVETAKLPAKGKASKALKPATKTRKQRASKATRQDKGSVDAQKQPIKTSVVITTNEVAKV